MNNILIRQDLANHAFYGLLIYSIVALYDPLVGLCVVSIVGVGKEVYDSYNKLTHTPDIVDTLFTIVPSMVLFLLELVI
jgi:hypothetical protein